MSTTLSYDSIHTLRFVSSYLAQLEVSDILKFVILKISVSVGGLLKNWLSKHIIQGGSLDEPSNFRLISVVSVVAKILEKIVSTQLSSYLEEHKLLVCVTRASLYFSCVTVVTSSLVVLFDSFTSGLAICYLCCYGYTAPLNQIS